MTSSLVGSEMCIRDRLTPEEKTAKVTNRKLGEARAQSNGPRWGGGKSVSYTHLTLPTICSV
eukprot:7737564-Prorocentrum_lima.AAC.1